MDFTDKERNVIDNTSKTADDENNALASKGVAKDHALAIAGVYEDDTLEATGVHTSNKTNILHNT